jgi:hypothetical protein
MRLPLNVVPFPGRRMRNVPQPLMRAEQIEDAVMPVVAIGVTLRSGRSSVARFGNSYRPRSDPQALAVGHRPANRPQSGDA